MEIGPTADMTCLHGMLTPPRHLVTPFVHPEVRVYLYLKYVFLTGFMRLMTVLFVRYYMQIRVHYFKFFFLETTLNIPGHVDDDYELPHLYWISKRNTTPYKERYKAGIKKMLFNNMSILLTNMLIAVKERLQMHCATVYTRSAVNQMWILKNSKKNY
jgi:hypothetical protein